MIEAKDIVETFLSFMDSLIDLQDNYTDVKAMAVLSIGRDLRDKMIEFRASDNCSDEMKAMIDKEVPEINEQINTLDLTLGIN